MSITIEQEIQRLQSISSVGLVLVTFTRAIHPSSDFTLETRSWIYRPDNFVTIKVHFQRANNITLSLRGSTSEFEEYPVLPLTSGMGYVYSQCKIEKADQLDAAAYYIRRALELYQRGRSRPYRKQKRIEQ